jgi:hypothetical protein
MWVCAITSNGTELQVRDRLALEIFCPYERLKLKTEVKVPRTKANPNPRTTYSVAWKNVARWPRYLFANVHSNEDLSAVLADKDVRDVVRGAEGEPCVLRDAVLNTLRASCNADGQIMKRSEILGIAIGDLVMFADTSVLSGHKATIKETRSLDDTGFVSVIVDAKYGARVHYSELRQ